MLENKPQRLSDFGIYQLVDMETDSNQDESTVHYAGLVDFILHYNLLKNNNVKHLMVLINQRGGSVFHARSAVQAMRSSHIPIATWVMGYAASAATVISVTGLRGRRFCFPDSMFMFHSYSTGSSGTWHDLSSDRKHQDHLRELEIEHYVKYSTLKRSDVISKLLKPTDTWLTAEEVLDYGLVDEVVEHFPFEAIQPVGTKGKYAKKK